MNLNTKNAKNIISKDVNVSKKAAADIVDGCDFDSYKTLCENSCEIFDFLIDKIIKNLASSTNKTNLKSTFEFAKLYNPVFEDYILSSWFKFADDDLTDSVLDMLENGNINKKIYAAKYFTKVKDPLALDSLNKFAFSENVELSCACACALSSFGDTKARNISLEALSSGDDFKKYYAMKFLVAYSNVNDLKIIIDNLNSCLFASEIAQDILYKYNYENLCKLFGADSAICVYDEIISAYPEDVSLETVYDFDILGFVKILKRSADSYLQRILADIKHVFEIINENSVYTYDLKGDYLKYVKSVSDELIGVSISPDVVAKELFEDTKRSLRAINTLINLNSSNVSDEIIKLYNASDNPIVLCECARAAKKFNFSIDYKKGCSLITDVNALELFKSYF